MNINADVVLKARKEKSWSQDELAIASGLNLRTIQRIEREASASLQSKKALGSALDLDIHDLDYQEIRAGGERWELVSATAMFYTLMTKVVYTLFLKRPVT